MAQRFEGKNLDEALESAGAALGVERYRLSYRVMTEKRGFLGGVKRVVIEAEINDQVTAPHEMTSFVPLEPKQPFHQTPAARGGGNRERGGRGGRRGSGGGERRRERGGDRERPARRREREDDFEFQAEPAPEQGEQTALAKEITGWFTEVFRLGQLELEARSTETEDAILIQLYGRDSRKLTDRGGELLDALQVIVNKSLGRREGAKNIECDAMHYKQHRATELEERARKMADLVRRNGREQTLPAMSPIERRIVHLALSEDAEVTTESRGEGFFKRVAIIPRSSGQSQAEP